MTDPCNPCQVVACIPPEDLSYNLQRVTPTPLPPVPPPPTMFGNAEVEYCCEEGDMAYDGTLPSWLTIDAETNCLIGAANTYQATTQAAATALAQAAIDSFVEAALDSGDLTCDVGCTCDGEPAEESAIITDPDTVSLFGCAYAPNEQIMFVGEQDNNLGGDMRIFAIDTTDNSLVGTITVASSSAILQMVYGSGQDRIYAISRGGASNKMVIINPADLSVTEVVLSSIPNPRGLAYDSTRDCLYMFREGSNTRVAKFDCVTQTETGTPYSLATFSSGLGVYSPTNDRIYVGTNTVDIKVINPATLTLDAVVTIPTIGSFHGVTFMAYSELNDKIIAKHYTQNSIHTIEPSTNSVINTINPGIGLFGMADHICRNQQVGGLSQNAGYFNVEDYSLETQFGIGNFTGLMAYCPDNCRVYACMDSNEVLVLT